MEIPGFKIERLIAEGGMASVYLAVQESLNRRVALKVLKKSDSPEHSQRFLYEGRIIASLNQRNIITIHDIGVIGGHHYVAMEYLEAGSLADRIERGMQLPDILDLLESIGRCLDFVHRSEIVHRDVKPANILFHTDGTAKLTDFGIAKQLDGDQDLTMDGSAFGSPYYLSPEQAEGRPLDGRSDIYSLGIVFYEMLTGDKPYAEPSHIETILAHLSRPIPVLPEAFSAYQDSLERMLAKDPEDRFASAGEMVDHVRELSLSEQGSTARAATIRSSGTGSGRLAGAVAYAWRESTLKLKIALGTVAFSIAAGAMLLQRGAGMQPEAATEIAPAFVAEGTVERVASATAVTALEPVTPDERQPPQVPVGEDTQVSRSETEETTDQATPAPGSAPATHERPEPADLAQSTPPRQGPVPRPDITPGDESDQLIDQIAAGAMLRQRGAGMQPEAATEIAPASVAEGTVERVVSAAAVTALEPVTPDERQPPQVSVGEDTQVFRSAMEETTEQATPAPGSDLAAHERPEPADLAQSTPPPEEAVTRPDITPGDESDQLIDQWLKAADQAFGEYRLTTPSQDNAYFYYQKVIELAPAHEAPRAGIALIADRYAALARKELNGGNRHRARLYVRRGIGVQSDHAGLSALQAELDKPTRKRVLKPQPEEQDKYKGSGNIVKDFRKVWRAIFY